MSVYIINVERIHEYIATFPCKDYIIGSVETSSYINPAIIQSENQFGFSYVSWRIPSRVTGGNAHMDLQEYTEELRIRT